MTPPDPVRRPDGYCYRYPTCRRKVPKPTERHIKYGGDALHKEPFCSVDCARAYYGTSTTISRRKGGMPMHRANRPAQPTVRIDAAAPGCEDPFPDKEKERSKS